MWRSISSAAPRAVARDSPMPAESNVTGESSRRFTWTAVWGSSGTSCAAAPPAPIAAASARCRSALLLHIYVVHRYVPGGGIDIAGAHGALGIHRIRYAIGAGGMAQFKSFPALAHHDAVFGGFDHDAIHAERVEAAVAVARPRHRVLEQQAGDQEGGHAGQRHRRARARKQRLAERHFVDAHAFPGRQPQPDIRFHLGRKPAPGHFRHFAQLGQNLPQARISGYFFPAALAARQMAAGTPSGERPEVAARMQRQCSLARMIHYTTASCSPRSGGTSRAHSRCASAPSPSSNPATARLPRPAALPHPAAAAPPARARSANAARLRDSYAVPNAQQMFRTLGAPFRSGLDFTKRVAAVAPQKVD